MGKTAYLATNYMCNQSCQFCPCSKNEKKDGMVTPFEELISTIDTFCQKGIEKVVISGGEPTLHPKLPEIIRYAQDQELSVVLLSNSERFHEPNFLARFLDTVKADALTVITTLHSHLAEEHENANLTPHSFERTLTGLLGLCSAGVTLIIKHCVTVHNYRDLSKFYHFVDGTFPERASIQLCSIDYCGIPAELLEEEKLSFLKMKPYLEEMFDAHLARCQEGSKRNVYCINIPLCSCDVYYWKFMRSQSKKIYSAYKDPHGSNVRNIDNNVGTFGEACRSCQVEHLCNGTYKTAFQYFGSSIIKAY